MSNKSSGNAFEREFAEALRDYGFWVHNLQQNASGQPADILAARDGRAYLIDCKVCENDRFTLSRMEDNQTDAMNYWIACGNTTPYFALKLSNGSVYMAEYSILLATQMVGTKSWNKSDICHSCATLKDWAVDA